MTHTLVGFIPGVPAFFEIYFVYCFVCWAATGYGYLLSPMAPSVEAANAIAPPALISGHYY